MLAFYVKTPIVFEVNSFLKIKTSLSSNKSLLAKKFFFLIETKYQKLKMNENNQEKINPCTVSPKYAQVPQKIVPLHGYHTSRNQMS